MQQNTPVKGSTSWAWLMLEAGHKVTHSQLPKGDYLFLEKDINKGIRIRRKKGLEFHPGIVPRRADYLLYLEKNTQKEVA